MPKPLIGCAERVNDPCVLNGCWVLAEAQLGGVPLPEDAFSELSLHVRNGSFVVGNDQGTITIDRQASPPAMDIIATRGPSRGRFIPAIFEHADGTLRICCDLSGVTRPRDFGAPAGTHRLLAIYRQPAV